MPLLSPVEHDFLVGNRQFTKAQQRYIRYRLNKKLKKLTPAELALLQDRGFLTATTTTVAAAANSHAAAASRDGCNGWSSLVRIPSDNGVNQRENKVVGRVGVEPTIPAMSRRYPNQARPPALYTHCKNLLPQIYVIDPLSRGNALFSLVPQDNLYCTDRNLLMKEDCDAA
jgi:hypothetical protein